MDPSVFMLKWRRERREIGERRVSNVAKSELEGGVQVALQHRSVETDRL